ncbi:hypothetical protein BHM03_00025955 [Ensete ventricosum]|nr:hypothetical protein BHM03_00025955 [Ensete ventricosum]
MAAMGISRIPPFHNLPLVPPNGSDRRPPKPFLPSSSISLSSSHHVSGEHGKLLLRKAAIAPTRRTALGGRTPVVVSPRAVSDSRSSQTCLDPDASRVSLALRGCCDSWISRVFFLNCFWKRSRCGDGLFWFLLQDWATDVSTFIIFGFLR